MLEQIKLEEEELALQKKQIELRKKKLEVELQQISTQEPKEQFAYTERRGSELYQVTDEIKGTKLDKWNCEICGQVSRSRSEVDDHIFSCPRRKIKCRFCRREINRQDIGEHLQVCETSCSSLSSDNDESARKYGTFEETEGALLDEIRKIDIACTRLGAEQEDPEMIKNVPSSQPATTTDESDEEPDYEKYANLMFSLTTLPRTNVTNSTREIGDRRQDPVAAMVSRFTRGEMRDEDLFELFKSIDNWSAVEINIWFNYTLIKGVEHTRRDDFKAVKQILRTRAGRAGAVNQMMPYDLDSFTETMVKNGVERLVAIELYYATIRICYAQRRSIIHKGKLTDKKDFDSYKYSQAPSIQPVKEAGFSRELAPYSSKMMRGCSEYLDALLVIDLASKTPSKNYEYLAKSIIAQTWIYQIADRRVYKQMYKCISTPSEGTLLHFTELKFKNSAKSKFRLIGQNFSDADLDRFWSELIVFVNSTYDGCCIDAQDYRKAIHTRSAKQRKNYDEDEVKSLAIDAHRDDVQKRYSRR